MPRNKNNHDLRRKKKKRLIIVTVILPIILVIGFLSYTIGGFYVHRQSFNLAIEAKENDLAEKELAALDYYYGLARTWRGAWLADKYLYHGTYVDKAVYKYIIGDYNAVLEDEALKDHRDNHLVSQLVGVSKFRQAEALYGAAKTDVEKEKILDMVTEEISEDFRLAVEHGPGPDTYFDHSFNYDLTTDKTAVKQAFEGPSLPRLRLKYGVGDQPGDKPFNNVIDPTKPGGGSGSKKKG